MSKSAILSSSIAKKYWMSLTGLFLCLFLVGHLIGNLQLINPFKSEAEIKLAFNQYAYFMAHNIFVKILSYVTYLSILFHAIDGFLLAYQNKKARPINYAYNKPGANSTSASRNMAILGSAILIFIVIHMANFWWKMKYSSEPMPMHTEYVKNPQTQELEELYVTHTTNYFPKSAFESTPMGEAQMEVRNGTEFYNKQLNLRMGEGYKDLYSLTAAFFGHDKSKEGFPKNDMAAVAVALYVLSMAVLGFHLFHGFQSAFQSLGINHKGITPFIKKFGVFFSIVVPLLFAIIPVVLFMNK